MWFCPKIDWYKMNFFVIILIVDMKTVKVLIGIHLENTD